MKLAVSNIAWERHDDPRVLKFLRNNGVSGIEIAPTKLWPEWNGASYREAKNYNKKMKTHGFRLPAMQAILFGKPELQIFNKESHRAFFEHIKLLGDLANGFGCQVLVFGAPKNRKRGVVSYDKAWNLAVDFFYKASHICKSHECCMGLEPNPVEYGCDFITNVLDAKKMVDEVNHKNFKLHLDSGGISMNGGDIAGIIEQAQSFVHYHISEPMLKPIHSGVVNQKKGIKALGSMNYKGWISMEMKQPSLPDDFEKSLIHVNKILREELSGFCK